MKVIGGGDLLGFKGIINVIKKTLLDITSANLNPKIEEKAKKVYEKYDRIKIKDFEGNLVVYIE